MLRASVGLSGLKQVDDFLDKELQALHIQIMLVLMGLLQSDTASAMERYRLCLGHRNNTASKMSKSSDV